MSSDRPRSHLVPALFLSAAVGGLIAFLSGCPGTLDDEARYRAALGDGGTQPTGTCITAPVCDDPYNKVIKPNCTTAGCHNAQKGEPNPTDKQNPFDCSGTGAIDCNSGLDLETEPVLERMSGLLPSVTPSKKGVFIDPNDLCQSYIWKKVSMAKPPGLSRMPPNDPADPESPRALTEEEIGCVMTWLSGVPKPTPDAGTSTDSGSASDAAAVDSATADAAKPDAAAAD